MTLTLRLLGPILRISAVGFVLAVTGSRGGSASQQGTQQGTPTVTVTPSSSSITAAQVLSVTATVSGGNGKPIPTGSVTLACGGYTSAAATLSGGSATISIPAGSLATGTDTLTASYTGDSNYITTLGTASVAVTSPPVSLAVSLGNTIVVVPQDGTAAPVAVTVTAPSGSPSVTVRGLPAGVTEQFAAANGGPSGTLTFTGSTSASAGSYAPTVTVTLAGQNASEGFTLVSAVVAKVGNATNTTLGVNGVLHQFMSTSIQVASWDNDFFGTNTTAREATLNALGPQHINLQSVSNGIPMSADTGNASDWNFTILDQMMQPVLTVGDKSPLLQIIAPTFMYDSNGDITTHLNDFAAYAANLVRYYNKGGFDWGGTHFQSASSRPIAWWGILNEFNSGGITASDYATIYNTVVPAMLAVDPTIKISALEFNDFGLGSGGAGDPLLYLPTFLAPVNAGGVNTQVNGVSIHLYGGCDQTYTDATLFGAVSPFAASVSYVYKELQKRADLAGVPVWVSENNVNADNAASNGMSVCNPAQEFVIDPRGTSAFFAAWRPYVFSQLGKAGNQALYQWDYSGNQQYGEVDSNGSPYLSYWVDGALSSIYRSTPTSPGPQILELTSTDTSSVETLATRGANGTVNIMVVDRAVHAANDNNGNGDPRTLVVDLSSFSPFSAASLLTIDANTNVSTGPSTVGVTPASRITITLPGYGAAFLSLTP
jgi:hypothetical protein